MRYRSLRIGFAYLLACLCGLSVAPLLYGKEPAFKIDGKTTDVKDLYKDEEDSFYKVEKQKYDLIEGIAKTKYLEHFWAQKAKEAGKSAKAVEEEYLEKNAKVSAKEVGETLEKFKDHPQLKKLPKAEQEANIQQYLRDRQRQEVVEGIIAAAIKKKDLEVLYPQPKEPVFKVTVNKGDNVRYGPEPEHTKPMGCADNCPITVVEYSEFQCPFCSRVLPSVKRLLTDYQGKVRWVVRDFPLSFHNRARPAAIAAQCASKQDKFWHMYGILFDNQSNLGDAELASYAGKIKGLDVKKWKDCVANPKSVESKIDENFESGSKVGVTGTPAFFINGRRLSGALPYEEFKRIFDDELSKGAKS